MLSPSHAAPLTTDHWFIPDPYPGHPRVRAIVRFTHGCLRVRHARIVQHDSGLMRLHMPDVPLVRPCPGCCYAAGVLDRFCRHCGTEQPVVGRVPDRRGVPACSRETVSFERNEHRLAFEREVLMAYTNRQATVPMSPARA